MTKTIRSLSLMMLAGIVAVKATVLPQTGASVTRKVFDFVVGVNGDFKAALAAASSGASSGKRFYIFFPNAHYAIGALTGDANQMTTITASNVSFIGESMDSAIISNKAINESISTTATINFKNADNIYMQDLTVLNQGNYYDASASTTTGRFVAIMDQGDKNIYKKVKLLSKQDTYYSLSNRTYWEDCEIHGFVDFICGYGDVFFNKCLLYLEQRSSVVITAPSTKTSWGYVFMGCTIDGSAGSGYRLGRPWSNQPKCVYINTTMKKLPDAAGWGDPMNVVPSVFAEYNSKTASGSAVDLSGRRTTYTKDAVTVTLSPVLTAAQAAQYTTANVVKGSDNWQLDVLTKQVSAPVVRRQGSMLTWNDDANALCWVVFKDKKYFKCVTSDSLDIGSGAAADYVVRAASVMGGLSAASNTVGVAVAATSVLSNAHPTAVYNPARKTLLVHAPAKGAVSVELYALNGKREFSGLVTVGCKNGAIEISLTNVSPAVYLLKLKCDAGVTTARLHVW